MQEGYHAGLHLLARRISEVNKHQFVAFNKERGLAKLPCLNSNENRLLSVRNGQDTLIEKCN
jgi:hypothetical protein